MQSRSPWIISAPSNERSQRNPRECHQSVSISNVVDKPLRTRFNENRENASSQESLVTTRAAEGQLHSGRIFPQSQELTRNMPEECGVVAKVSLPQASRILHEPMQPLEACALDPSWAIPNLTRVIVECRSYTDPVRADFATKCVAGSANGYRLSHCSHSGLLTQLRLDSRLLRSMCATQPLSHETTLQFPA